MNGEQTLDTQPIAHRLLPMVVSGFLSSYHSTMSVKFVELDQLLEE